MPTSLRLTITTCLLGGLCLTAGCPSVATPGSGKVDRAELTREAVQDYLARAELDRGDIVNSVLLKLRQGKRFRDRVVDQKNRWTLLTVWLDGERQSTLRMVTKRDETCPTCKGDGKRRWKNNLMENFPGSTRCLTCKGEGVLRNHTKEYRFGLSSEDYRDSHAARAAQAAAAYKDAPAEAAAYVKLLGGTNAQKRLVAAKWLDQNYVQVGGFFQNYMPMLRKARWMETASNGKTRVWEFWAGKGIKGQESRAYYRVYADMKKGKITKKGFFPAR